MGPGGGRDFFLECSWGFKALVAKRRIEGPLRGNARKKGRGSRTVARKGEKRRAAATKKGGAKN